mmetsp:Transcript_83221/g.249348  ORF Transcript_83221/g.249348 Transcript_83221/m.249348 type:complete len:260 (+) Transcript_83221:554-1333(+)
MLDAVRQSRSSATNSPASLPSPSQRGTGTASPASSVYCSRAAAHSTCSDLPRLRSYTRRWKGRCRLSELAGMLSGVAIEAPASIAYAASRWVVACSASTLLRIVPELDQPTAANLASARPPSRVRRRCATAVRMSSFAPRYAEKSRGDVTGLEPQARMLITATCQPRSAACAAIERTYVSWLPPPSPDASSSIGRLSSSGGGSLTKKVSDSSSAAPAIAPPDTSASRLAAFGLDCFTLRMPASRSMASVPPSGVGTRSR